jgi:hypothetical protein
MTGSYRITVIHLPRPATMVVRPATVALLPGAEGQLWVNAADSTGARLTGQMRLAFASSDTTVAVVDAKGRVTARSAGSALVTTTLNGRSAETTVRVEPREEGAYRIDFLFVGALANEPALQAIAREAAARWERVIVGALPPQQVDHQAGMCAKGSPAISVTTTGMLVVVTTDSLPPGVVGYGGPCFFRPATGGDWRALGFPAVGVITLDSGRVRSYLGTNPTLARDLITHEIGHALGVGTRWQPFGSSGESMRVGPESDYRFIGEHTMAASTDLGFTAPGELVPVENQGGGGTAGAHWRRSVYGPEVMNGWLSYGGQPLTAVTAGLLRDIGYEVRMVGADVATAAELNPGVFGPLLPLLTSGSGVSARRAGGEQVELEELPYDGPVFILGRDGRPRPLGSH